jgi:hypothetical protein
MSQAVDSLVVVAGTGPRVPGAGPAETVLVPLQGTFSVKFVHKADT